jgi:hypothetical protein
MMHAQTTTPQITLAVDPGIRGCGCALFEGDQLRAAWYETNPIARGCSARVAAAMARQIKIGVLRRAPDVTHLALEMPVVRDARHSKGDPNDLIPLAAINGALCVVFSDAATIEQYAPEQWKGQLDKQAMNARALGRLSLCERERITDAGALAHNVYDAIGLGLHFVGRLKPAKIYPSA